MDTSVWIAGFRGRPEDLHGELEELLERREVLVPVVVRLELLAGTPQRQQRALAADLAALPTAEPTADTWSRMEAWVTSAAAVGKHFSIPDLLIAALAAETETAVWSLDRAFPAMAELGWIKLYVPRYRIVQ